MSLSVAAAPTTMDDLPHEVLAYVFLHVRGPPASGALRAARGVCRRWREVIDAHLKLVAPCKLYVRAFQLGYLSPRGLLSVLDNSFAKWLDETLYGAARARDGNLFLWCGDLIEDKRLTTQEQVSLQAAYNDTRNRVQCGIWEGLTRDDLLKVVYYIHPADMLRARSRGIRFEPHHLKHMLANGQEEDLSGWNNDDIRTALTGDFSYTLTRLLDFLIRREIVTETTIEAWIVMTLQTGPNSYGYQETIARGTCAHQVLDVIETRGWLQAMTTRTFSYVLGWRDWALIQRVTLMRISTARQVISWHTIGATFHSVAQLDWFYSLGFFDAVTTDAANEFLVSFSRCANGDNSEHIQREFAWYLAHLPAPTSTNILVSIVAPSASRDVDLLAVLLQHHTCIPWDPLLTYFVNRGAVRELFKTGYRLPTDIDMYAHPLNDAYYAGWSKLIAMATEFGQPPTALVFRPVFLAEAAKRARGRDLLVQLARAGVVLPEELRGVVEGRAE